MPLQLAVLLCHLSVSHTLIFIFLLKNSHQKFFLLEFSLIFYIDLLIPFHRYNTQLVALKRELKSCKSKLTDQHKQMMEYATRMDEYDKKFEESSRKFSTVLQVRESRCFYKQTKMLIIFMID